MTLTKTEEDGKLLMSPKKKQKDGFNCGKIQIQPALHVPLCP